VSANRKSAVERTRRHQEQSVNVPPDHKKAQKEQVERLNLKSNDASDQFFVPQKGDHIHHIRPSRLLDRLFENTNDFEKKQLVNVVGSVNGIQNLIIMAERAHLGKEKGTHSRLIANGLTPSAKYDKQGMLIKEIEASGNAPFGQKLQLAHRYNKELKPLLAQTVDDAMTDYHEPTRKSQQEARWRTINRITSMGQLPLMTKSQDPYLVTKQSSKNNKGFG